METRVLPKVCGEPTCRVLIPPPFIFAKNYYVIQYKNTGTFIEVCKKCREANNKQIQNANKERL